MSPRPLNQPTIWLDDLVEAIGRVGSIRQSRPLPFEGLNPQITKMTDDYPSIAKSMHAKHGRDTLRQIDLAIATHIRNRDAEMLDHWREVRRAYVAL